MSTNSTESTIQYDMFTLLGLPFWNAVCAKFTTASSRHLRGHTSILAMIIAMTTPTFILIALSGLATFLWGNTAPDFLKSNDFALEQEVDREGEGEVEELKTIWQCNERKVTLRQKLAEDGSLGTPVSLTPCLASWVAIPPTSNTTALTREAQVDNLLRSASYLVITGLIGIAITVLQLVASWYLNGFWTASNIIFSAFLITNCTLFLAQWASTFAYSNAYRGIYLSWMAGRGTEGDSPYERLDAKIVSTRMKEFEWPKQGTIWLFLLVIHAWCLLPWNPSGLQAGDRARIKTYDSRKMFGIFTTTPGIPEDAKMDYESYNNPINDDNGPQERKEAHKCFPYELQFGADEKYSVLIPKGLLKDLRKTWQGVTPYRFTMAATQVFLILAAAVLSAAYVWKNGALIPISHAKVGTARAFGFAFTIWWTLVASFLPKATKHGPRINSPLS